MRYRYLDDFRRGISVFAIFSYGIAVLGTPQCPPPCIVVVSVLVSGLIGAFSGGRLLGHLRHLNCFL